MRMRTGLLSAAAAAVLMGSMANAAVVVLNGDFQTGDFTGWAGHTAATTLVADAGQNGSGDWVAQCNYAGGGYSQFLTSNYTGAMTGIALNTAYVASYDIKAADLSLTSGAGISTVVIRDGGYGDGPTQVASNISESSLADGLWHHVTFNFTSGNGTGGSDTNFKFIARGVGNPGATNVYFDNFAVSEVPEPTSMALLGLGALALLRRKR
jgi:hypothetical protein